MNDPVHGSEKACRRGHEGEEKNPGGEEHDLPHLPYREIIHRFCKIQRLDLPEEVGERGVDQVDRIIRLQLFPLLIHLHGVEQAVANFRKMFADFSRKNGAPGRFEDPRHPKHRADDKPGERTQYYPRGGGKHHCTPRRVE